jgi:hypothetical protein
VVLVERGEHLTMSRINWQRDNARRRSRDSETLGGELSAGALAVLGAPRGRRPNQPSKAELRAQAEKAVADLVERQRAAATMRPVTCPACSHPGEIPGWIARGKVLRCSGCGGRFGVGEFLAQQVAA